METDVAAFLLQLAREGGSAAGGALVVLLAGFWFLLSGRLVLGSQHRDVVKQRDTALRELKRMARVVQAGVHVGEKLKGGK